MSTLQSDTMENSMPWKISIVRLPLPRASLPEWSSEPKETESRHAPTETEVLVQCHKLVQAGYEVDVTGPNNVHWNQEEVLRRLN